MFEPSPTLSMAASRLNKTMPPPFTPRQIQNQVHMTMGLAGSLSKYNQEFLIPFLIACNYFSRVEVARSLYLSPMGRFNSYMDLLEFNADLILRYFTGSFQTMEEYAASEVIKYIEALYNTFFRLDGETLEDFYNRQFQMVEDITQTFPEAIRNIEPAYGFHFERGRDILFAETERFTVYKISPTDRTAKTDDRMKPVLIVPPFVLGHNILAFLPDEGKSYTHSFANQGIPTYIRVTRPIAITPAVQTLSMEDDALDTAYFCKKIMDAHGKQVTLNGYCQGGYSAVCNHLSGRLDGLVDSLITCVSPMDGTRSKGLGNFLKNLPSRFNDLVYGTKTLPNGNKVADGELMGWVYKLKSIEDEAPIVSFFRDLFLVSAARKSNRKISTTAAALNYWLQNERCDLPLNIAGMSFASYNTPITGNGVLPFKMFGEPLNLNRLKEKKIAWLICYGENDDLVEKETALAPLDFIDAEVTAFPKGHVAIATSWCAPGSPHALHKRFGKKNCRGPVRFQLDLNAALDKVMAKLLKKVVS